MTIARDLSKILDANGDLNIDAYTLFVDSSTNRVGIGTSSPNRALSISSGTGGSETIALEAISGATDANTATTFRLTNSTGFGSAAGAVELKSLRDGSGTGASFVISGSTASSTVVERMRINSSGNVGIGTSSPNQKLTVAGNIEIYRDDADGYIWFHDFGTRSWALGHDVTNGAFVINSNSDLTANNRFAIATNGNVGIGTSSPSTALDVNGTVTATAFSGDGSGLTGLAGVPSGIIAMWSGSSGSIPSGWNICDGTNGTPNLTDKFIKASGTAGSTGGSTTSGATTLSTSQMPSHKHNLNGNNANIAATNSSWATLQSSTNTVSSPNPVQNTGGGGSHTHSVEPPYYTLIFIMKA